MADFRLSGLIAAPYTPFNAEGDLYLDVVEEQAALLAESGVSGAFICGTTGEGLSLTSHERMEVARQWMSAGGRKLKVIVHVGHTSQREAIALARHAGQIGAAAVAALPPFFFKPTTAAQVVEFCRPIAAAAADLPFYYYNIPSMTGVSVSMVELLELASKRIPNFRGIKFTHGDMMEFQRCRALNDGEFDIAWGVDEMLLGALAIGTDAAVGSTYNYAAPLYLRMIEAFRAGDLETAQEIGRQVAEMVAVLLKHGVLRTGKATMSLVGIDCGPPRSPVAPVTREEWTAIRAAYEKIAFFEMWNGRARRSAVPALAAPASGLTGV
ncbi:MAG: dihydrodipicolinate synthase family protein [Tepidisphaeraceae bacterium]